MATGSPRTACGSFLDAALSDVTPAQLALLRQAIGAQERMLNGCILIFRGLSDHHDPEVSSVSGQALQLITHNRDILDAMIDGSVQTKH